MKMYIKDILIRQRNNTKVAIEYLDKKITYAQMNYVVENNTKLLLSQSKSLHCNNIGLFLPNSISYAIGYFTIAYLDRIIIPIEVSLSKLQFLSIINYCEIGMVITEQNYLPYIQEYCKEYSFDLEVFLLDMNRIILIEGKRERTTSEKFRENVTENSVAIMLHTSGTTSNSQKVMLSHKNLITNIELNIESLGLDEDDKTLIVLPMFFGYCNSSQFLTPLYLGASIVIANQPFNLAIFLKNIEEKQCTNTTCVPSILFLTISIKKV